MPLVRIEGVDAFVAVHREDAAGVVRHEVAQEHSVALFEVSPGARLSAASVVVEHGDTLPLGPGSTVRAGTGVDTTNELVVWPWIRNRSSTLSRSSIRATCTFSRKQSSPEIRWHSLTSGVRAASSAMLGS